MARASEGKKRGRVAPLPLREAAFHELSRDQLSVFLYLALLPEETRAIVKELGLSVPGFRPEALGDVERCDAIADEIRARPAAAGPVGRALSQAFETPPLARRSMEASAWEDVLQLCGNESALALALWRVLSDGEEKVRRLARPVLDELAQQYYAPPADDTNGAELAVEEPAERAAQLEGSLKRAEERLRLSEVRAAERAEEVRRKAEEQRQKFQASLREARARESRAVAHAARARDEGEEARKEASRLRAELEVARTSDAGVEAQRLRSEARELAGRANALESRLERALGRAQELETELERARAQAESRPAAPSPERPASAAEGEPGEVESAWLLPIYTQEFYDSLERWDRRIQRAAFKQAHLLGLDHRHPSLRALPLEGLPGYYRVRVATDVRLIYRRAEKQNTVEILSLIDREDLDRYIRQAKTRA